MNWHRTSLGLISLALAGVVGVQLQSPRLQAKVDTEVLANEAALPAEIPSVEFKAPVLEPLLPKLNPISVCDHCADNSCAPEPAIPEYPTADLEADCMAKFFVDEQGRPFDIIVQCSNDLFVRSAKRAVAKMRWPTKDLNGAACRHIGQTDYPFKYPINYRLD